MSAETVRSFGALKSKIDIRDYKLQAPPTAAKFPESFELKMCAIKNQGSVGSCVAHALAEVAEYYNFTQQNSIDMMSVGFIYGDRRNSLNKSSGMYPREALSNMCKYGTLRHQQFPYNKETPEIIALFNDNFEALKDKAYPNRFSTYFRVYSDEDIKYALMNYGPVVFAMDWYKDIKVTPYGIIESSRELKNKSGGHCMVIYGWNESGWEIMNSWGTKWGIKGKAILPYDFPRTETWGVTDEVTNETPDIVKPMFNTTLLKIFAKIANWFLNLFSKFKK